MPERATLIAAARQMQALGLTQGTAGNLSLRVPDRFRDAMLITPSALAYESLTPEMIPVMRLEDGTVEGPYRPSSEWRFHRDIYLARPEVGAVIHNHAPYVTALAIARREIPACHYMIARFGGAPIRCAPYALFGTEDLSRHVLEALRGRSACLMANHGCLVTGPTIAAALAAAIELEALAKQYLLSLAAGGPVLLSEDEIAAAIAQFAELYRPNLPNS